MHVRSTSHSQRRSALPPPVPGAGLLVLAALTVWASPALAQSTDATLSGLTVGGGTISPAFDPAIKEYWLEVESTVGGTHVFSDDKRLERDRRVHPRDLSWGR